MIPIHGFDGRKVAVFGLGLSGIATARALRAGGAAVAAWDDSETARAKATDAGLPLADLAEIGWQDIAALVLAPGVPLTHPEPHWTVRRAETFGTEIIGDTELFFRELARSGARARVIAITGTNGKSTTAALTAHLLRAAGRKVALGGNIGTAILDLPPPDNTMVYVIEFSSYQIDLTPALQASSAALLNVTADHLDRHGTVEHYAGVKARIFSGLAPGDRAVIGVDDEICRRIADGLDPGLDVVRVSVLDRLSDGVVVREAELAEVVDGEARAVLDLSGIRSLRGVHNWQNAAAAYALARHEGLDADGIRNGFSSFPGLAHRMEEVGRLGPALFINDSKATNADAAAKALASFDSIYWIAGGQAKEGGIADLESYHSRIKRAYLIGEATEPFAETLSGKIDHVRCGTVEAAVAEAARDAARACAPEPVVLFSPACASFDQFPNFVARGDAFRAAVSGLAGVVMQDREAA
ncbi:MAG: UDP-N-acetylmuramoyl-L-alanine--D-glutamate ligase [Methyloligellaceae bacterium]